MDTNKFFLTQAEIENAVERRMEEDAARAIGSHEIAAIHELLDVARAFPIQLPCDPATFETISNVFCFLLHHKSGAEIGGILDNIREQIRLLIEKQRARAAVVN
jgi:hypothetical protein